MKIYHLVLVVLLTLTVTATNAASGKTNEQKLNSTQQTEYLRKILIDSKSLSAVSYAENFVADCRSAITLDLFKVHTDDNQNELKLYYVCTDDPSHDSTVTIFLDKNGNIVKGVGVMSKVEFGIE